MWVGLWCWLRVFVLFCILGMWVWGFGGLDEGVWWDAYLGKRIDRCMYNWYNWIQLRQYNEKTKSRSPQTKPRLNNRILPVKLHKHNSEHVPEHSNEAAHEGQLEPAWERIAKDHHETIIDIFAVDHPELCPHFWPQNQVPVLPHSWHF